MITENTTNISNDDSKRILAVRNIIKTHTDKLNVMKDNLSKWQQERWSDAEIQECQNMIKLLASILSDLNNSLK